MTHHFFGYGSLVNRATHAYPNGQRASLAGWRRAWVHTAALPRSFLSVIRDPGCTIHGLIAEVPGGDWSALDIREEGYTRQPDQAMISGAAFPIQVYAIPDGMGHAPAHDYPILLSYVDAVVQGFLTEYGDQGAAHFFETTTGWDAPILNDRKVPQYPRSQRLSAQAQAVVDAGLRGVGAKVLP
ncbi:gamma-glutamylcyclotransferase family protein [Pseudorhodobacter sp.]|uniref:gamma-glutamylcyclotransferase family protein n=1 Tax=Pseudorhodobacter sp. TaxID=1934400 RepID=UPI00264960B4|nr:gamma-glutamylcyclotransferase family protein [Pseudorhodobacter sp.]MDN5786694.1 gamma-glutamylcyclotransferase [Pseudorhodobacter sp.]